MKTPLRSLVAAPLSHGKHDWHYFQRQYRNLRLRGNERERSVTVQMFRSDVRELALVDRLDNWVLCDAFGDFW